MVKKKNEDPFKNPLAFFSDDQLIDELEKRFESSIFSGMKSNVKKPGDVLYRRSWKGNTAICIGLSKMVGDVCHSDFLKKSHDASPLDC